MVCKAVELLVTCKLVISGLNLRCHFRYDQEGNVLLRSAVIHLKQDGRRGIFRCHFLDLSSFFYLSLAFPEPADCYNEFSHSFHATYWSSSGFCLKRSPPVSERKKTTKLMGSVAEP